MKFKQEHILDELLVMRTQNGDMQAFSLLVKRWQPALLRQAYRLTRNDDAAQDVAQETWQAIAKGIYRLKSPGAFKTWAYRIVSNKSANWVKEKSKKRNVFDDNHDLVNIEDLEEPVDSFDAVKQAMTAIPVKSKVLLSMFYVDNQSVREISVIMKVSEGTVKSRLFYARRKFKEIYEQLKQLEYEK